LLATRQAPPSYLFGSDAQFLAAKDGIEALLAYVAKLEAEPVCRADEEASDRPYCGGPRPRIGIGSRAPFD